MGELAPIKITFRAGATAEDYQRVMAVVRMLPGVAQVETLTSPIPDKTVGGRLQLDSRWCLLNTLGINIAAIGNSQLEASMLQLFLECRGVFRSRKILYACLKSQFPAIWDGHASAVGKTYERLVKKLAHTGDYALLPPNRSGLYGLQRRSELVVESAESAPIRPVPDAFLVDLAKA